MRTVLILLACAFTGWHCHSKAEQRQPKRLLAGTVTDTSGFRTLVQPILQKNCSPCHFPGGKLYEKLPFDKAETIINHESGIFKRIKKEEEVSAIKKFLDDQRKTNGD